MESHTRFDLNSAISDWTAELSSRGPLAPEKVDELECHLCDGIAALQHAGLDEAEAFLIATRRLGSPAQLATEFAKGDSPLLPRVVLWWLVLGVAAWTTLRNSLGLLESLLNLSGASLTTSPAAFAIIVGTTKLLSLGGLIGAAIWMSRHTSAIGPLVQWCARHPWRMAGAILLGNAALWAANILCSITGIHQMPVELVGSFAQIAQYGSFISSVATLGIAAVVLAKLPPTDFAR